MPNVRENSGEEANGMEGAAATSLSAESIMEQG